MEATIRPATTDDIETIAEFNFRLASETEHRQLDRDTLHAGVTEIVKQPGNGEYWVAEIDDKVVAQISVTYEWSDWRNGRMWWIQSVYVHADYRRHGIFSQLYRFVESLAAEDPQACGLRLYVEKDNEHAIATYKKLGMITTDYRIMETQLS